MAFLWIILFGLLGSGLASAKEIVTRRQIGMPGTREPSDVVTGKISEILGKHLPIGITTRKKNGLPETGGPSTDDYWQMVSKIYNLAKSRRMVDELVGQNEFEVVQHWNINRRLRVPEMPHETFKRVKRGFLSPGCGADEEDRFISCNQANNDFVSGSTPRTFQRNRWDEAKATMGAASTSPPMHNDFGPDSECYDDRKLRFFRIFNNLTDGGRKVEHLKATKPDEFVEQYKSKRQSGCSCEINFRSIGCACCFVYQKMNIQLCAGCGYTFTESKFFVRITVESFTLFKYEKDLAKSAFSKYLTLFAKSLCIPHQFSVVLTACLKLTINFIPSFIKGKPSKLAACPSIVAQLFVLYDVTLLELPCWELNFRLPFFRVAGEDDMASITYEGNLTKLEHPVKELLAPEDTQHFEMLEKLVSDLGEMEKNNSQQNGPRTRKGEKWIQNTGEPPRMLKRGNPSLPINWKPVDLNQVPSLVVLYTQPLGSPLTEKDLEEEDTKAVPNLRKMTQDAMDRQLPNDDPSIVNLKVHAVLGKSCGGVILTRNKILTLCACIKFFYMFWKYKYKLQPADRLDVFTLLSKDIYVTNAHRSFTADQVITELDNQEDRFMKRSRCFDAIKGIIGKPLDDGSFTATHMHSVVMTVTRDFDQWERAILIPQLEHGSNHMFRREDVDMTVIGLRKARYLDIFGADGYEFDPLYEVVEVPFVTCRKTSFCRNPLGVPSGSVSKEFDERTKCFCAKDLAFQLCDGVVGFPLRTPQGVIGLNAVPIHCKGKGSTVGALFTGDALAEIYAHLTELDPPTTIPGSPQNRPTPESRSPRPIHLSGFILAASVSITSFSYWVLIA